MKPALPLAALLAAVTSASAMSQPDLDAQRWKSRVLVVVSPRADDGRLAEQRRLFEAARRGAKDRDLVWIEGVGAGRSADALRQRFGIGQDDFAAILVGKDGGAKLSSHTPLAAERLFSEIDAMPMRRDEMRDRPGRRP